jgi:CelD/BcsL family acetyltransferase involved in cellulose biosynthesis
VEVSQNSWKSETGTTLDQPGPGAFIRRLSKLASERGWLSIWMLTLDGRPMATEYQLVCEGNVHGLRSDFRRGSEEISPGSHLNRMLLEQLFGRGYRRYFMGPGNNAYKFRWAEDTDAQVAVTIYSRSIAGRIVSVWERRLRPWASALKARFVAPPKPTAQSNDD